MRASEFITEKDKRDGIDLDSKFIPATADMDEKLLVTASAGGKQLGRAYFINYDGDWEASDVAVDERFQGQGIAALMYDYAKEHIGSFNRSPDQTDAGEAFWDKHRPNQNVWED
jgi:GNAT superfamily N-acetyltransferase